MTDAPQSSFRISWLPALIAAGTVLAAAGLEGQQSLPIRENTAFRKSPQGVQLGTILSGTTVVVGQTEGDWREVTLEGWIFSASVRPDTRDGFDLAVGVSPHENLRQSPNRQVLAQLSTGALLSRLESRGAWTRVRRSGWVESRALGEQARAGPAGRPPPPSAAAPTPSAASAASDRVEFLREAPMLDRPEGAVVGSLQKGATARVVGRAGEWTRVQVETWVKSADVGPTTAGIVAGVTAAEVRANPARYLGAMLEWRVQFIALQEADELRPEIPLGRTYLLTRGPLPEPGFVYIMVAPDQLEQFETAQPLQEFRVRGRLRAAKTKYLPNPVLELETVIDD